MRNTSIVAGCLAIWTLDLSAVKRKIMEPQPEGKGWTQAQADEAERWYKRYLEMCLCYPDEPIVPNHPIDSLWHQHILDTRAYAADCDTIFGELLHHYPYYGLNGDAEQRDASFDRTNELYLKHFGENCLDMTTFGAHGDAEALGYEHSEMVAAGCGDKGSGTGCKQGCKRGG